MKRTSYPVPFFKKPPLNPEMPRGALFVQTTLKRGKELCSAEV